MNEMARREWVWLRRWLVKPSGGLLFFGLYIAASFIHRGLSILNRNRSDQWIEIAIYCASAVGVVSFVIPIVNAIVRRSLLPFRKDRLHEIVLSSLDNKSFWPALLVGPLGIAFMFSMIEVVITYLNVLSLDLPPGPKAPPVPGHPLLTHVFQNIQFYQYPAQVFSAFGAFFGAIVFAICLTLPRTNLVVLLVLLFAGAYIPTLLAGASMSLLHHLLFLAFPSFETMFEFQVVDSILMNRLVVGTIGTLLGLIFLPILGSRFKWRQVLRYAEINAERPAKKYRGKNFRVAAGVDRFARPCLEPAPRWEGGSPAQGS